ncbi:MAG: DUF5895 domain-containing protein [Tychonema bourrellyi B0820]|nr:DUF5895 domain-containing protein [Tychonema bourrellyi B0820]PJE45242.1 MAG: hypothetical protein CUR32_01180 [Flavobacterium sp.] [Flavobacterium sp. FEMGT703F]
MTKKSPEIIENNVTPLASEFEFDPSLLGEEFNAMRVPRLPYGIVINDNPCGIFIPEKNAIKAGWSNLEGMTEIDLASGAKEKGLFFPAARIVILGNVAPYIRYKSADENGELKLTVVGSYEFDRDLLDKKTMEVVSEHLVMFVDKSNNLLHTRPIRIRFKNVALWSLREAIEEFYLVMEMCFAKLTNTRASGKNDKWRSLCVFDVEFKAVKEGEGSNRSWCMKVDKFSVPTLQNFGSLFLGTKQLKEAIWEAYDMNIGSLETQALSAAPEQRMLRSAE